jgi:hypothetical protein
MDGWMDGGWTGNTFSLGFNSTWLAEFLVLLLTKQLTSLNLGYNHLNGVRLPTQLIILENFWIEILTILQ